MVTPVVRALDHLVLPVCDLEIARSRYRALGFTVAPNGRHPFGTENANIFFVDNTFLEPLAVADAKAYASALEDNTFVRNDKAARAVFGEDCFSHVVLCSDNAQSDDRYFLDNGISGGPPVRFCRAFKTLDGAQQEAEFLLAFAGRGRAPDGCFFTCEAVRTPSVDRSSMLRHANGAIGIVHIISCMTEPVESKSLIKDIIGDTGSTETTDGIRYPMPNSTLSVLKPAAIERQFEVPVENPGSEMRHCAIVVGVEELAHCRRILEQNEIDFKMVGDRTVVPPVPGQGAFIVFEDNL